jgi:hypothetical protein
MASKLGPFTLMRQAMVEYRRHAGLLVGIVLWVALPAGLISTFAIDPNVDSSLSAYVALMQIALNVALLQAVVALKQEQTITVRQAYYQGSSLLVRMLLLTALLLLLSLPLILALLIMTYGVAAPGVTLGLPEKLIMGGLAAVVALPGLALIGRSVWAIFVIAESPEGPVEAVRTSWRLTADRSVAALGRLLALGAMILALLALPVLGLTTLAALIGSVWPYFVLQVLLSLIALPLTTLYLYNYYRSLRA